MNIRQIYKFFLTLVIGGMLFSCGDYPHDEFSKEYATSPEEQKILDMQDSIREALRAGTLILEYDVEIVMHETSYDGFLLEIDLDMIADRFDMTVDQLVDGIRTGDDVKGFAVNSNGSVDLRATNTNGRWGHWWNADGDVTTWGGDNGTAMVFAEWNTNSTFPRRLHIGQYPNRLEKDQEITIIQGLSLDEKRVEIIINITAVEREVIIITAPIVGTQHINAKVVPNQVAFVQFDLFSALRNMNVGSLGNAETVAGTEGSYEIEYNAPAGRNNGFWYDMDGKPCSPVNVGRRIFAFLETSSEFHYRIGIGQLADACEIGDQIVIYYNLLANNRIEQLVITIDVVADPDLPPAGEPYGIEMNFPINKVWDNSFGTIQFDVKDLLRNAFKKTTYQLFQDINSGTLKVYLNVLTETPPTYTAPMHPAYWVKKDGTVGTSDDGAVLLRLTRTADNINIITQNHPTRSAVGDVIKITLIFVCDNSDGKVTLNITYTLT